MPAEEVGIKPEAQEPDDAQRVAEATIYALKLLDAVKEREQEFTKGWWKEAESISEIYGGDAKVAPTAEIPYNILYSNTEVLLPSLYSSTPKPDVRSRFREQNVKPLPQLIEKYLTVGADPASPGGDCFDNAMQDCVLSSLVPGLGYVRIRYIEDRSFPITYESGHFKTLVWGKASRWSKVPWAAFVHPMKRDQLFKQFDIPLEQQSEYTPSSEAEDDKDDCCVYEVWDKASGKVYFLCEEWSKKLIKSADDPLGLENFFPTPGPLLLTMKPGKLQPVPLYAYYRNQAEELNRVSVRLQKVIAAIKVRGAYNGLLGDDLAKLLTDDDSDNKLIKAEEAGLLAQSGGFDKHIWLLPIEKLITVAQELYKAREATKQVIYELTGISDIIRGSSVASETATAQDLKNKWGTVRLRRMQKIVADYARDLFRMTIDCSADHVPPQRWLEIAQMAIPTEQEKAQAKMQMQQQLATLPPGTPPPKPDPKQIELLQSPPIEQVLGRIKSDMNRTYTINIQTSSTVDLDTAQDKAEVSEFMAAMGQLLPGLQGLSSIGPSGLEAAKAILMAVCQRFKFGVDVADVIGKIEPPPTPPPENKGPTPEEQQAAAAEAQYKMQEIAAKTAILKAKTEYEIAKIEADKQKLGLDIQAATLRLQQQRTKLPAKEPKSASVSD